MYELKFLKFKFIKLKYRIKNNSLNLKTSFKLTLIKIENRFNVI